MKWNLKIIFFGQTWATLGQILFHSRGPVLTRGSHFSVTFTDMNTCWPGSGSEMLPTKVTIPYRETNSQSDCVPTTTSPIHFDPTSSSFTFFPAATEFLNTHTYTDTQTLTPLSQSLGEGLGAGGEGDDRGCDGWVASLTWWTWVWVNSGSWWWTGRPGVLQFMLQRVGHDWVTELNWTELMKTTFCILGPLSG